MTRSANSLDKIKRDLQDNAETLLPALFGEPSSRSRREWRWGRKGSMSYRFDRGTFWNFETDQGGNLLNAIMFANGSSFGAAIDWARSWLGEDPPAPRPAARPRPSFDADAEKITAADEARALWRAGRGIHRTAAARYLQGRAVDGWPAECVRFIGARDVARIITSADGESRKAWDWWRWSALMFPLTDGAGDVAAVQLVALTDQGEAVKHWEHGGKLKIVRGVGVGSVLRLPGDAFGPLVIAEGGETALSVWLATGHETWATVGSIGRAPIDSVPLDRAIIVARDDDPPRAPARKTLRDRLALWRAAGRHVVEAQPWALSRGNKTDFNDALQTDGPDAVRDRIDQALRPQATTQGKGRADALLQLATAVGRGIDDCLTWQGDGETAPPFKVIRATLGLGKSQAALEAIIDAVGQGHRVIYSAPTHELAAELQKRAQALAEKRGKAITCRVWHGREREDPDAPGQSMCQDLKAAKLAQQAGIDVIKTVCDAPCQFRDSCAYLAQRKAAAELWIVPHALLFAALPATMKGASLLVIDEGFALAGLIGVDGTDGAPLLVPFKALTDHVTHGSGDAALSADLDAALLPVRRQLLEALADHPASSWGEPLQRAPLVDAGLTVELADEARKGEGKRRRDVSKIDAATRADLIRKLTLIQATNSAARRTAMLWSHVSDLLTDDGAEASGSLALVELDNGERAFRLYGIKAMGNGWRELPTLHLDATADMGLIRQRVPDAELVANVEASEPHVQVHQVVGRAFGKMALEHGKAADDARRFALAQAAEYGGRWLIVASKAAADEWRPTLPDCVGVAHWGDVRGLDAFKDVRGVVCVGRWGVTPNAVGRIAAILTGRAVPRVEGWFPTETMTLTAADDSRRTIDVDRHPDTTAEAVRASLVEAELMQAIGRGRGVQRGAGDPLTVYVLGNVPLPIPLASISDWQPVDTDRAMMADHGAWLESAGDAGEVTGKAANAVKAARHRLQRMGTRPYNKIIYGHVPNLDGGSTPAEGLAVATYQRTGAGRSETRMIYSRDRISDPRAWLVAQFGPLAYFELDDQADTSAETLPTSPPVYTHDQLAQMQAPRPSPLEVASTPPPAITLSVGLDVPIGTDLTDAFTVSASTVWPDVQANIAPAWGSYAGGIMPATLADFVRTLWPRAGITQQQLADRAGISRPQLANALLGRFGLSKDAAARLRSALVALPPAPQGMLL